MKIFFLVLARDARYVHEKIKELENLGFEYKIICGGHYVHPNVVYQAPNGKYSAINFGVHLIPADTDIVVMNDVDTIIHNFDLAPPNFNDPQVALVFGTELVKEGPQHLFFRFENTIRRILPISGSGELMLIRRKVLVEELYPLKPCKAEDTYMLFKIIELKRKIVFCENFYAETERTKTAAKEEEYKRRTVAGIYQALSYTKPTFTIKMFYSALPLASPLLLVLGDKGYYWFKGILLGFADFLRGDKAGSWKPCEG
jgi:cellulose synthase/poly-beta-1,6-N-acetylglucosamine synthase-like glycosyltransferase